MKKMLKAKKGRGKQSVAYRAMGLVLSAAVALGMPRAGVAAVRRGGGGAKRRCDAAAQSKGKRRRSPCYD